MVTEAFLLSPMGVEEVVPLYLAVQVIGFFLAPLLLSRSSLKALLPMTVLVITILLINF